MRTKLRRLFSSLLLCASAAASAQTLDPEAYKQFLRDHETMSAQEVLQSHSAGVFAEKLASPPSAIFLDSITQKYALTEYEQSLLARHGFMVTERLSVPTFVQAYADVYHKDLPVFVSTDGILHALHMSYSNILSTTEYVFLRHRLADLLTGLREQLPALSQKYSDPRFRPMLTDLDVYLTLPLQLLGTPTTAVFNESQSTLTELRAAVNAQQPIMYPLFSSSPRTYDFSQFTPRGHYAESKELSQYFQAMMWLGRTELYLTSPKDAASSQTPADIQRQTIVAALLLEAANNAGSFAILDEIESVLGFLVGEQDNVTLKNLKGAFSATGMNSAADLLDIQQVQKFQEYLTSQPYAFQRITSQILYTDPYNLEATRPASAVMLIGQRFILDSYITSNVVYDRLKSRRMLPSPLDVLFTLGNNAAAQLLQPEIEHYNYGGNLTALRYLVDSYDSDFWKSSYYNFWLSAIRTLNPPQQREHLPAFMQTAAWWQQKINTQLASWTQLRHDNLLYAKQSYSAGVTCSFPYSYVEPIPEFYAAIGHMAREAKQRFSGIDLGWTNDRVLSYFTTMGNIADQLETIARKELDGTELTEEERNFLSKMLFENPGCGETEYTGWYADLYFEGAKEEDRVVADIHTAPTDAEGSPVGWVMHVGTGPINMGVWTVKMPDGKNVAFVGPTLSYYEYVSTNFKRLTDQEWQASYQASESARPSYVNVYLADKNGGSRGNGAMLHNSGIATSVEQPQRTPALAVSSYPNPFDGFVTLQFSVPADAAYKPVSLSIYSAQGREIRNLFHTPVSAGNYMVRWNGDDNNGQPVVSGAYMYRLRIGGYEATGTLVLNK